MRPLLWKLPLAAAPLAALGAVLLMGTYMHAVLRRLRARIGAHRRDGQSR